MLTPLICSQCGGKLEVEESQVIESSETMIVLHNQTIKCPHCDTEYLPGEKLNHIPDKVVVSNGGVFIGGNINAGTVVTGDRIMVESSTGSSIPKGSQEKKENLTDQKTNPEDQKPHRKWWQFWKT